MFKTLLLLALLTTLNADDYWSGCADNLQDAKTNLAANILVKVESSISSETQSSFSLGFESFTKNVHDKQSQNSTMLLSDLKTYNDENNQTCVKVSKTALKRFTKENIKSLDANYAIKDISGNVREKAVTIDEWLLSLKFLKGLTDVFSDLNNKEINAKIAKLKNIRSTLATQYVKIVIHGSQLSTDSSFKEMGKRIFNKPSKLKIDGVHYSFSREIFLKTGKHSYSVEGEHCKINNAFILEKNDDKTISINLDDYSYPTLIFSSNKESVRLEVNGESESLGKSLIIEECSGEIHFELNYSDGEPEKISDEITLEPGLNDSFSYSFLSNKEIKALNSLVESFKDGNRLELSYTYAMTDPEILNQKDLSDLHQFGFSYLTYKNWLRHGYRGSVAIGEESTYSVSATYMAALQITTFGAEKKSFRISNFAVLVPYIGAELGFGYNSIYNTNTTSYENFFKTSADEETNFLDDYVVFKPLIGTDIILSEDMAIGIEFSKALTMQKSYNFGFHLSLGL